MTLQRTDQLSLSQLQANDAVAATLLMRNAAIRQAKNGKPYLACVLADKTGEIQARMFDIDEVKIKRMLSEPVVWVEGKVQSWNNSNQLMLTAIDAVTATPEQLGDLLPRSEREPEAMFVELLGLLRTLEHPASRAIARAYIEDRPLMDRFIKAPAAKSMHHAVVSGLLEHTLSLLRLADVVCPLYPQISRDVVMLGLLVHDMAKTVELSYEGGFDYTDRGNLVGHIADGLLMLREKVASAESVQGEAMPRELVLALEHIVVSHHGTPEFGALKLPSTPEAVLVSLLDNLDAKTWMAVQAGRSDRGGGAWTEKHFGLGTRIYKTPPL